MYHRIAYPSSTMQSGMYVTPETFNKHLKILKHYFNVIPLSEYLSLTRECNILKSNKPLCIITFDDGWKDFYDLAFPLLRKYDLPATVFLPTRYIDSDINFWTDDFAYLIANRNTKLFKQSFDPELVEIIGYLERLSGPLEQQLEAGVEYLKKYSTIELANILFFLSNYWQVDLRSRGRVFLNWMEINEMMETGLISFGSHTVSHEILTTVSESVVKKELEDSRDVLLEKKVINETFSSFCYPNGNYTQQIADSVRASGYDLAVTTQKGWNFIDADKFTLKRIGIHEDISSTDALFACRIAELI